MKYQIIFIEEAAIDLKELKSYIIRNFSKDNWRMTYSKIKSVLDNLKKNPFTGHIVSEIEDVNLIQYRQIISEMNRIIYEIRQYTVYIHIIVDTRRDMASLLNKRLLHINSTISN